MEYTVSNTIKAPLDNVVEKFFDPNSVEHWMEGYKGMEHLKGTPGQVGAETNFTFEHKGKEMIIHETILERNSPNQVKFAYRSKMGYNEVEMIFEKIDENSTSQTNHSMFKLKGGMKLFGWMFKGMMKKQSMTYLTSFKDFVEKN